MGGEGGPGDEGVVGGIDADPGGHVTAAAAEIGGIAERRTSSIELGHKGVRVGRSGRIECTAVEHLEGSECRREISRPRVPCDVGVAACIQSNARALVQIASAK